MNLKNLSDRQLLEDTKSLAQTEREITTKVLWHLAEIQRRKLYSPLCRSLYAYGMEILGYSEDQASRRIAAMRLLVELPEIEEQINGGALTLTALGLAQTFFRSENKIAKSAKTDGPAQSINREYKFKILNELAGKSTRDAQRELIERSTAPEKLYIETEKPISSNATELKIAVEHETLEKIRKLKGLLAHKHPHLSTGKLFDLVCGLALEKLNPAKASLRVKNNAPVPAAPRVISRCPPAAMKRDVWRRADGKCEHCGSIHKLEIDHRLPFALGGKTEMANLRLLCRNCNERESFKIFGDRRSP